MKNDQPILLDVDWDYTSPLALKGYARGGQLRVMLHRWGALQGAAVLQLTAPVPEDNTERLLSLPVTMEAMAGHQIGIDGKECGRLAKVRIAIDPGVQDSWALHSHVDMDKADDLFIARGGQAWEDLTKGNE